MVQIIQGQRNWSQFETTGNVGVITTIFSEQYLEYSYNVFGLSYENYQEEIELNNLDTVFIDNDLFEADHPWYKKHRGQLINFLKNNNINICVIKNTLNESDINTSKIEYILYNSKGLGHNPLSKERTIRLINATLDGALF